MSNSDLTIFVSRKHCNYMAFLLVPRTFRTASATAISDQVVENRNYLEEQWSSMHVSLISLTVRLIIFFQRYDVIRP